MLSSLVEKLLRSDKFKVSHSISPVNKKLAELTIDSHDDLPRQSVIHRDRAV